jgi:hypothetical protein
MVADNAIRIGGAQEELAIAEALDITADYGLAGSLRVDFDGDKAIVRWSAMKIMPRTEAMAAINAGLAKTER